MSFNCAAEGSNVTSIKSLFVISTSKVSKPRNEILNILFSSGTVMVKFPSKSVTVPMVVPFTTIFACGKG